MQATKLLEEGVFRKFAAGDAMIRQGDDSHRSHHSYACVTGTCDALPMCTLMRGLFRGLARHLRPLPVITTTRRSLV